MSHCDGTAEHTTKRKEPALVTRGYHLGHVHQQTTRVYGIGFNPFITSNPVSVIHPLSWRANTRKIRSMHTSSPTQSGWLYALYLVRFALNLFGHYPCLFDGRTLLGCMLPNRSCRLHCILTKANTRPRCIQYHIFQICNVAKRPWYRMLLLE